MDYDCKKWRLFADVLNDLAMLIEILTPVGWSVGWLVGGCVVLLPEVFLSSYYI